MKSRFWLHWSFWNHFRDLQSNFNVVVIICFPHPDIIACCVFRCISKLLYTDSRVWSLNYSTFHLFVLQEVESHVTDSFQSEVLQFAIQLLYSQLVSCCFVTVLLIDVIPHKAAFLEPVFIRLWTSSRTLSKVTAFLCPHISSSLLSLPGMSSVFFCLGENSTHIFLKANIGPLYILLKM